MNSSLFFSFADNQDNDARKQQPVEDDFVSAHIQTSKAEPEPEPKLAPAPDRRQVDQVHPLMRNRRLDTPEDIAAWVAERKANYPTNANILRKKQSEQKTVPAAAAAAAAAAVGNKRKRPESKDASNPLSNMLMNYNGSSSEDEDDDDDEPPEQIKTTKLPPSSKPFQPSSGIAPGEDRRKLRVCRFFAKGKCNKGSSCPFAHPDSLQQQQQQPVDQPPNNGSLLKMLLSKDIYRENYRIHQCIKYILDNDYLGTSANYELLYKHH